MCASSKQYRYLLFYFFTNAIGNWELGSTKYKTACSAGAVLPADKKRKVGITEKLTFLLVYHAKNIIMVEISKDFNYLKFENFK